MMHTNDPHVIILTLPKNLIKLMSLEENPYIGTNCSGLCKAQIRGK
ncbi:MAG: hypothetical protein JSV56_00215 [Methanomassiliicoccales archaeon]|nr:MAG: hypothetical protein JSV56_00215 [Methanomassiliicoccales archaeon]